MTEQDSSHIRQGFDHVGELYAKLRDLRGYDTLANELLQNADDAGATKVIFDVCDGFLMVENNTVFKDCGDLTQYECSWKLDPNINRRCDFHRFTIMAGGDKRNQEGTTGAFGFGFVSVYQLTNHPELISGNRHWRMHPEETEDRRIRQNIIEPFDGTRFILPWSTDPECTLRRRLGSPAIRPEDIEEFAAKVAVSIPQAVLFLRHVTRVEIKRNGTLTKVVLRKQEGNTTTILNGEKTTDWHVFEGNFDAKAALLRNANSGYIEAKRQSKVLIAICHDAANAQGLYYATLPTQQQTSLPVHVNADFYPESSRKNLAIGTSYKGAWNDAAIAAAADALANALPELADLLGYQGVWRLISQVEQVYQDVRAGRAKPFAGKYWEAMKPAVSRSALVYTSVGEWRTPDKVYLLESREQELPCLPILEHLNLPIVHPELNTHRRILKDIGVSGFTASNLSNALINFGLDKPIPYEEAPQWLRDSEQQKLLATEIDTLLGRVAMQSSSLAKQKMADCAVTKSVDGRFCPPAMLWNASPEAMSALEPLGLLKHFVALDNPPGVLNLVKPLDAPSFLTLLENVSSDMFERLWTQNATQFLDLIGLCADCDGYFQRDTQARERLRKLKIWPAGDRLHSLHELVVPGNFVDPIGLATLVDERVVAEHRKFLIDDLKAKELTVQHYAGEKIPEWLNSGRRINADDCHQLLAELAKHINALRNETHVQNALAACALIPCRDTTLRSAKTVYFASEEVTRLLGENALIAIIPDESKLSVEPFLKWLGVTEIPRPADVVAHIKAISQLPPNATANRERMQKMFYQLGKYWHQYSPEQQTEFTALRTHQWLPVEDKPNRWFVPSEVHTLIQKHLFATTGLFLDVPYSQQQEVVNLRNFLPIETKPSCELVVKHLLNCVIAKTEVHKAVYAFLNEADQIGSLAVQRLKGQSCLLMEGGRYARPDEVFWKGHKFHPYLNSLRSDFGAYRNLLDVLRVRDEPQAEDAIKLLRRIAEGNDNKRLDEAKYTIIMDCWALISSALLQGLIEPNVLEPLRECKVIPNQDRYLQPPRWMYFEDKPKLAERFESFLKNNVILKTPSTGIGMEAAGVRPLSRAVEIRLVECTDPVPAYDIQQILQERRLLIERVTHSARIEDARWNTELLTTLKLQWCSRLEVGYTLKAFNQKIANPPESADTFYDAADETLYIQRSSEIPWLDISSGVAHVMNRDAEEGTVAASLSYALSASSFQKGSQALDKLKVPPLQADEEHEAVLSTPVGMGGIDTAESDGSENNANVDDACIANAFNEEMQEEKGNETDENRVAFGSNSKPQQTERSNVEPTDSSHSPSTQNSASMRNGLFPPTDSSNTVNNGITNNADRSSKGAIEFPDRPRDASNRFPTDAHLNAPYESRSPVTPANRHDVNLNTQNRKPQRTSSRSAPSHDSESRADYAGRLRSYVFSTPTTQTEDDTRRRNPEPIDKAGMAHVLTAEQQAGRVPEAMPHNNPGYDIYSLDATGENERYIEVKSLSSDWKVKGVLVSARQFTMAQHLGLKFWLYVVERADQDDFCITRIQNPAQRVNEFMFDDGWRTCMEVEDDKEEQ